MSVKEINHVIEDEAKWCEGNPATGLSADYQNGFIDGLRQAINVIAVLTRDKEKVDRWDIGR